MKETNNFVVLMFEGEQTAATVYEQLEKLEKEKLLTLKDAIVIEREGWGGDSSTRLAASPTTGGMPPVVSSPEASFRVKQMKGKKGSYAAKGGGIGLLAGFLIGGPVGGLVVGAGIGALTAGLKDLGIDDDNIAAVKARLQPNTSALLLLGTSSDRDALTARLRSYDPQVISTSLPPEVEEQVRAALEA